MGDAVVLTIRILLEIFKNTLLFDGARVAKHINLITLAQQLWLCRHEKGASSLHGLFHRLFD